MVDFAQIPSNLLVPFVAVEFDGRFSSAGSGVQPYKSVLVGQRLTTGTRPLLAGKTCTAPVLVTNANEALVYFGEGSQAHRMAIAYFKNNQFTETWMIGQADAAGTADVRTLTVTGPATASGTIPLYIGGERVAVSVAATDTADDIAAAIIVAVNDAFGLSVTAVAPVATDEVDLTARNMGTAGAGVDVRIGYYSDDVLPAGVSIAVSVGSAGATDPTAADAFSVMGDTWFNVFVFGWRNSALLTEVNAELASRNHAMRSIDGRAYFAIHDTLANLVIAGAAANSEFLSWTGVNNPMSPEYEYAAAIGAVVARRATSNTGEPYQGIELVGILGPVATDEFTISQANTLLSNGVSAVQSINGVTRILRLITQYQRNSVGAADTAYRDVTTWDVLSFLRWDLRTRLQLRFPASKLADDGTRVSPGSNVATPSTIKGEILAWYREKENDGLVENFEVFKANLVVLRDDTDRNRVNILVPADLINMLIVQAVQIQFRQ